jgi:hypothetical protein
MVSCWEASAVMSSRIAWTSWPPAKQTTQAEEARQVSVLHLVSNQQPLTDLDRKLVGHIQLIHDPLHLLNWTIYQEHVLGLILPLWLTFISEVRRSHRAPQSCQLLLCSIATINLRKINVLQQSVKRRAIVAGNRWSITKLDQVLVLHEIDVDIQSDNQKVCQGYGTKQHSLSNVTQTKNTYPPFHSRGWSVTNWRKRVLNSCKMSKGVSKLTITLVLKKPNQMTTRQRWAGGKDTLKESSMWDARTTSHMGPLRRTLRMCFFPKRTELGATITCPSQRWKVVEKSPNSRTNMGESSRIGCASKQTRDQYHYVRREWAQQLFANSYR